MLRAYDKATGREVGRGIVMPRGQTGTPMTYMLNGKPYSVSHRRAGFPRSSIAFKLPG